MGLTTNCAMLMDSRLVVSYKEVEFAECYRVVELCVRSLISLVCATVGRTMNFELDYSVPCKTLERLANCFQKK